MEGFTSTKGSVAQFQKTVEAAVALLHRNGWNDFHVSQVDRIIVSTERGGSAGAPSPPSTVDFSLLPHFLNPRFAKDEDKSYALRVRVRVDLGMVTDTTWTAGPSSSKQEKQFLPLSHPEVQTMFKRVLAHYNFRQFGDNLDVCQVEDKESYYYVCHGTSMDSQASYVSKTDPSTALPRPEGLGRGPGSGANVSRSPDYYKGRDAEAKRQVFVARKTATPKQTFAPARKRIQAQPEGPVIVPSGLASALCKACHEKLASESSGEKESKAACTTCGSGLRNSVCHTCAIRENRCAVCRQHFAPRDYAAERAKVQSEAVEKMAQKRQYLRKQEFLDRRAMKAGQNERARKPQDPKTAEAVHRAIAKLSLLRAYFGFNMPWTCFDRVYFDPAGDTVSFENVFHLCTQQRREASEVVQEIKQASRSSNEPNLLQHEYELPKAGPLKGAATFSHIYSTDPSSIAPNKKQDGDGTVTYCSGVTVKLTGTELEIHATLEGFSQVYRIDETGTKIFVGKRPFEGVFALYPTSLVPWSPLVDDVLRSELEDCCGFSHLITTIVSEFMGEIETPKTRIVNFVLESLLGWLQTMTQADYSTKLRGKINDSASWTSDIPPKTIAYEGDANRRREILFGESAQMMKDHLRGEGQWHHGPVIIRDRGSHFLLTTRGQEHWTIEKADFDPSVPFDPTMFLDWDFASRVHTLPGGHLGLLSVLEPFIWVSASFGDSELGDPKELRKQLEPPAIREAKARATSD